jgi:hypothetical protein
VSGFFGKAAEQSLGPPLPIRPYISSSKEYTLNPIDQEKVTQYRAWL